MDIFNLFDQDNSKSISFNEFDPLFNKNSIAFFEA
jgi:hypothetical protein